MTAHLQKSMYGILLWLKEHQPVAASLDELTAQFEVPRDFMETQLQSLQRHECVKRGGRDHAGWLITDEGLVRLADGRFSSSGAFLSRFDVMKRLPESNPIAEQPATLITIPLDGQKENSDTSNDGPTSSPTAYNAYLERLNHRAETEGDGS